MLKLGYKICIKLFYIYISKVKVFNYCSGKPRFKDQDIRQFSYHKIDKYLWSEKCCLTVCLNNMYRKTPFLVPRVDRFSNACNYLTITESILKYSFSPVIKAESSVVITIFIYKIALRKTWMNLKFKKCFICNTLLEKNSFKVDGHRL